MLRGSVVREENVGGMLNIGLAMVRLRIRRREIEDCELLEAERKKRSEPRNGTPSEEVLENFRRKRWTFS